MVLRSQSLLLALVLACSGPAWFVLWVGSLCGGLGQSKIKQAFIQNRRESEETPTMVRAEEALAAPGARVFYSCIGSNWRWSRNRGRLSWSRLGKNWFLSCVFAFLTSPLQETNKKEKDQYVYDQKTWGYVCLSDEEYNDYPGISKNKVKSWLFCLQQLHSFIPSWKNG